MGLDRGEPPEGGRSDDTNSRPISNLVERYLAACYDAFLRGAPQPELARELEEALDGESRRQLEAAVARLREQAEVDVRRAARRARKTRPKPQPEARATDGTSSDGFPEVPGYTITKFIDAGRFGRVYRAISQQHFGVPVALKILWPPAPAGPDGDRPERSRFLAHLLVSEARILAHIGHRNVVRYLGSDLLDRGPEAGTPFIATALIDGGSLAQRIGQTPQDPRWSARILARVADALEFVHQLKLGPLSPSDEEVAESGILHRDVKPSNILLGPGDEPFLTDFGLAGRVGRASAEDGFLATTPSYAAPEQRHEHVPLTPAVDVYGLGATLYRLLTGKSPRRERAPGGTEGSAADRLVPPGRLAPRVPVDLEKVCLKCLEEEPSRRYQTAGAVRDELTRFLEGKPVLAHPVGPWGRWTRWACHDPRTAALAVSLFLAGVFVFGMMATLYWRESIQADTERRLRSRGDELARVAQEGVDLTVETVMSDAPAGVDGVPVSVRKAVAVQVIPLYDRLIALQGDAGAARAGTAKALILRAKLRRALGTTEEDKAAVADLLEAARLYAEAAPSSDQDLGRAQALLSTAAILGPQARFQEAITYLEQARTALERLVAAQPDRADYRLQLALCLSNEANCHRFLGERLDAGPSAADAAREFRAAEHAYSAAIDQAQWLVQKSPREPRHREWLSRTWSNLGDLHLARTDTDEPSRRDAADRALRQARRLAIELDRDVPDVASIQDCLVTSLLNYGEYLRKSGRPAEAVEEFGRARLLYDRLHDRHPDEREYRWGQALARVSLGAALLESNAIESAWTTLEEAARQYDLLVAAYPKVLQIAAERSQTYNQLARLGLDSGSAAKAALQVSRAIRVRVEVLAALARSDLPQQEKSQALILATRQLARDCVEWVRRLARLTLRHGGTEPGS